MTDIFNFPAILENHGFDLSLYDNRQKIEMLEWMMLRMEGSVTELPTKHTVHAGIYERELFIPAGTCLTGKVHLIPHIFHLLQGDLSVMADDGMKRIQAPARFNVGANTKKIGYAHTDVICATFHRTELTDIDEIEKEALEDSDLTWIDEIMNSEVLICQQ